MPQEFARRGIFTNRGRTLTVRGDMQAENHIFISNKIVELYGVGGWGDSAGFGNILGVPIASHGGFRWGSWYLEGLLQEKFQSYTQGDSASYYITNGYQYWEPEFEVTGFRSIMHFGYEYLTPALSGTHEQGTLTHDFPYEYYFEIIPGNPPPEYFAAVASITWSHYTTFDFGAVSRYQVTGDEVFDPHREDQYNRPAPRNADFWELPRAWTGEVNVNGGDYLIGLNAAAKLKWGTAPRPRMPYQLATWKWRSDYQHNPAITTGPASQFIKADFRHVVSLGDSSDEPSLPHEVISPLTHASWATSKEADVPMGKRIMAETHLTPVQTVDIALKARQLRTSAVKPVSGIIVEGIIAGGSILFDVDAEQAEGAPASFTVVPQTISGTDPTCQIECGGTICDYNVKGLGDPTSGYDYSDSEGPQPDKVLHYVQARYPWEEYRNVSGMWKARLFPAWDALRIKQATKRLLPGDGQTPPFTGFWSYFRAQSTWLDIAPSIGLRNLAHKRIKVRLRSFNRANVPVVVDLITSSYAGLSGVVVSPKAARRSYTITTGAHNEWVERTIDVTSFEPSGTLNLNGWDELQWEYFYVTFPSDQPSPTWRVDIESVDLVTDAGFVTTLDPGPGTPQWQTGGAHGFPPLRLLGPLHASQGGWPSWHPQVVPGNAGSLFTPEFKPRAAARTIQEVIEEINRSFSTGSGAKTPYRTSYFSTLSAAIEQFRYGGWSATNLAVPRSTKPNTNFVPSTATPYDQNNGYTSGSYVSGTTALPWAYTDLFDNDAPAYALGGDGLIVTAGIEIDDDFDDDDEHGPMGPVGPATLTWTIDIPTTDPGALIKAQYVGQSIRLYPGCGNIGAKATLPGSFDDTTEIDFWAIVEGEVAGQVIGAEDDSADIEVNEIREHNGTSVVTIGPVRPVGIFEQITSGDGQARGTEPLRGDRPNSPYGPLWNTGLVNRVGEEDSERFLPEDGWEVWPVHRHRRWVRFWHQAGLNGISNLHGLSGFYMLASQGSGPDAGKIRVRRWEFPVPSGSTELDVLATAGPSDKQPALYRLPTGRVGLLYTRASDVYETFSDDDGATWSTPTLAFADAHSPVVELDHHGTLIRAAICKVGSDYLIKATRQHQGDTSPSSPWTLQYLVGSSLVDLKVAKRGFDIKAAPSGSAPLVLACVLAADTTETNLVSYDDGTTWLTT